MPTNQGFRTEHDFLGEKQISNEYYYGIQTLRAVENFDISGIRLSSEPLLIKAFAQMKKAAAFANRDLDVLDANLADYIGQSCDIVASGALNDQFVVDLIQGGAGTSTNMNANEVITNKGLELMGKNKGEFQFLHPNNHVNASQSTNDAYPTSFRIALYWKIDQYIASLVYLSDACDRKAEEFKHILKMGRTQLQDAVPMTLGSEFHAFAVTIREDIKRLVEARDLLTEINIGATAIGTGLNAPEGYAALACKYLADITGIPLSVSEDLIEATSDTGAYVQISGTLKRSVVKISRICNDLRLLSSGPRAGMNEINLPKRQPGSSIMPGKVNPVIPEVANQTAFYVIGMDLTVTMAAEAGQLQLNVMEPIIGYALFTSLSYMTKANYTLVDLCINDITANEDVCRHYFETGVGIVTALNPILGYETCAALAKEAMATGGNVYEMIIAKGLLDKETLDEVFKPENLLKPMTHKPKK